MDQRFLPAPSRIVRTGAALIADGTLVGALLATLKRLIAGFAVGVAAGIAAGLALGLSRAARSLLEPVLSALYTIPKLAILPLLLLIFGAGEMPLVVLVAITVFFYMWLATMQAAVALDPGFRDAASVFGASRRQHLVHVIWPAVLPQIVGSVRIAWGVGVLVVIGAEFVNASTGLGALVWQSWSVFLADRMYVGIAVISLIGVGGMALVDAVGAVLTPWTAASAGGPRRLLRAAVWVAVLAIALVAAVRARPTVQQAAVTALHQRKAEAMAPRPLGEPVHLRVASAGLGGHLVPLLLAAKSGELERENLSAEIVTAPDSDSLPLLTRGDLDVVVGVPSAGFLNAAAANLSIRWVSGLTTVAGVGEGIYVRRPAVKTPEFPAWGDLRHRKVGTLRGLGGMQSYVIGRHMLEAGLDPNEVDYVRLRSLQDIFIALKNGSIDAGWLAVPMSSEAANLPDLLYLGGWPSDDRLSAVYFGPTLLERNRSAGMALLRAMERTIDAYLRPGWAGDKETAEAVAALVDTPVQQLRETAYVFDLELPTPRGVRRIQHVLGRYPGLLKAAEPLPDERVVDRRFTDVVFEDDP